MCVCVSVWADWQSVSVCVNENGHWSLGLWQHAVGIRTCGHIWALYTCMRLWVINTHSPSHTRWITHRGRRSRNSGSPPSRHGSPSIDWQSFLSFTGSVQSAVERIQRGKTRITQLSSSLSSLWSASKAELWTITTWNSFNCLFDLVWHKHANTTRTALLAETYSLSNWQGWGEERGRGKEVESVECVYAHFI